MKNVHSEGASSERVAQYTEIAGDGDLDERCRRIMAAWNDAGMDFFVLDKDKEEEHY